VRGAARLYNDVAGGMEDAFCRVMSFGFIIAACAFALVLGCAVACVDWWREARLPRLRVVAPAQRGTKPVQPATQRRAA
jgi:hypothetical protein